ncbi:MAG: AzlC family ABC transporter permease [Methanolobus sp.]|nr:AzlC family ABC transporter permease [Methanolobus sp.]
MEGEQEVLCIEDEHKSSMLQAFRKTIPVMFGYIPLGIAFGLLVTHYGFHWGYSVLMSLLIFSGAGQFLAVALTVAGAGMIEIVLSMLFLNLRHSFFGLSLINRFARTGKIKPYLIFGMTDETYALITGTHVSENAPAPMIYGYITGLNHLYWVTGSLLGALIGQFMDIDLSGLEFALTALFVVLSIEQYRTARTKFPFIAALIAGGLAMIFAESRNMLLISIIIGSLLLMSYEGGRKDA